MLVEMLGATQGVPAIVTLKVSVWDAFGRVSV